MGSLHVKFHDYRYKGKAIMRKKSISVINTLLPSPLDPEIIKAHPGFMESLCVKFYDGIHQFQYSMHYMYDLKLWPDIHKGISLAHWGLY